MAPTRRLFLSISGLCAALLLGDRRVRLPWRRSARRVHHQDFLWIGHC